jgi:hypothetical protein
LDEVFAGFAGRPAVVVRQELEVACQLYDCRLDQDMLDVFAREIAAGERVEIEAGAIRIPPDGLAEQDWREAPF